MVTATLRENIRTPITKYNNDWCLQGDQKWYSTCTFWCPVRLMSRISNFSPLVEKTLYQKQKFHSLILFKRNSPFMRFYDTVNGLKTFYINIKILNVLKSRLCFKESHHQLQNALVVDLVTQAHMHMCVSTFNKVIINYYMFYVETHVWACACVAKPASSASCNWQ